MRRRLALIVLAVTGMITVAFLVPLAAVVKVVAHDRALALADQEARSLQGVLSTVSSAGGLDVVLGQLNAQGDGRQATAFLPGGRRVGATLSVPAVELRMARQGRAFTAASGGETRVWVSVVRVDGRVAVGVVSVPARLLDAGVVRAWVVLGVVGALIVAVGVVLADRFGHSTVRAIEKLGEVTRSLREGDLAARVEPQGPVEVANVGRAVNALADRVIELLEGEREAAADLSHSLRTPLAGLQLEADSLRHEQDRQRMGRAVRSMTEAIDEVIVAVRRAGPEPEARSDLAAITAERLAFWELLAGEQDRQCTVWVPKSPVMVGVPKPELVSAVDALVGNVFAHTPEGAAFRVQVHPPRRDQGARLIIEDDGPGLPPGKRPARGESGAGSTGLGLDIVARTAGRSGGELRLGPSSTGGARIEVCFGAPEGAV